MKTPRHYQERCIDIGRERNALYALQGGLGKTLPAIVVAAERPGPRLILATSMAKHQWKDEILDYDPTAHVVMLGTAGRMAEGDYVGRDTWVVTHWESLIYCGETLIEYHWGTLIADEAHRIMNRRAKRSLWTKQLPADRKLALTGTPFEKNIDQLWSILNFLYKQEFKSYWHFVDEYCLRKQHWMGHWEIMGPNPRTLPRLMERISPFTIRMTKEQAFPEMPAKVDSVVNVPLTEAQQKIYNQLVASKDIEVRVDDKHLLITNALSLIVRLQQIAVDPKLLGFQLESSKLAWIKDYIIDNPDEKIVVFTKFRDTAIRLAGVLDAALIVGGEKNPSGQIAKWAGSAVDVLVGTIAAMGESLDLPWASAAIFLDQEWSSLKMAQAVERIDRATSDVSPIAKNIIRLVSPSTVDELVMKALVNKWTQQEMVFHFLDSFG